MRNTGMNRAQRRVINSAAAKRSVAMKPVPITEWPKGLGTPRLGVWVNRDFLVQAFQEPHGLRLSVNRTTVDSNGDWRENITWEELQQVKRDVGFGDYCAVEVYPADADIVNVANMRHLWILNESPPFVWKKGAPT